MGGLRRWEFCSSLGVQVRVKLREMEMEGGSGPFWDVEGCGEHFEIVLRGLRWFFCREMLMLSLEVENDRSK